jgi:hypothetical protein
MTRVADVVRSMQSKGDKLSSQQDFRVLDNLLIEALRPLELETAAYREWLGEVIVYSISSRRRQNEPLLAACIKGISGAPNNARALLDAGINRAHVFSFLRKASDIGQALEKAQMECARRRSHRVSAEILREMTEARLMLGVGERVVPAIRTSAYWHNRALAHKRSIISHYMMLMSKTASRISYASGGRVEANPAFNDAYLAAESAVDRFRADAGVFAPYLARYLKGSSRSSASHALGLAAPGYRVLSADALQADSIDAALNLPDSLAVVEPADQSVIMKIDAIATDPDVRAALMVGDIAPPAALALRRAVNISANRSNL